MATPNEEDRKLAHTVWDESKGDAYMAVAEYRELIESRLRADRATGERDAAALYDLGLIEKALDEVKTWDDGHPNKNAAIATSAVGRLRALLAKPEAGERETHQNSTDDDIPPCPKCGKPAHGVMQMTYGCGDGDCDESITGWTKPEWIEHCAAILAKSGAGEVAWRDVALRLGEELASSGPPHYYDMTPDEWYSWAEEHVARPQPPVESAGEGEA
jgi:hypothetical protein